MLFPERLRLRLRLRFLLSLLPERLRLLLLLQKTANAEAAAPAPQEAKAGAPAPKEAKAEAATEDAATAAQKASEKPVPRAAISGRDIANKAREDMARARKAAKAKARAEADALAEAEEESAKAREQAASEAAELGLEVDGEHDAALQNLFALKARAASAQAILTTVRDARPAALEEFQEARQIRLQEEVPLIKGKGTPDVVESLALAQEGQAHSAEAVAIAEEEEVGAEVALHNAREAVLGAAHELRSIAESRRSSAQKAVTDTTEELRAAVRRWTLAEESLSASYDTPDALADVDSLKVDVDTAKIELSAAGEVRDVPLLVLLRTLGPPIAALRASPGPPLTCACFPILPGTRGRPQEPPSLGAAADQGGRSGGGSFGRHGVWNPRVPWEVREARDRGPGGGARRRSCSRRQQEGRVGSAGSTRGRRGIIRAAGARARKAQVGISFSFGLLPLGRSDPRSKVSDGVAFFLRSAAETVKDSAKSNLEQSRAAMARAKNYRRIAGKHLASVLEERARRAELNQEENEEEWEQTVTNLRVSAWCCWAGIADDKCSPFDTLAHDAGH